MPTTRDDQIKILQHLLYEVLNIDPADTDHAVLKCFKENDITNIDHFEGLTVLDIDGLTYTKIDPNTNQDNTIFIPVGHRGNLRHLQRYVKLITAQYYESHNTYPPLSHWKTLTWEMFQVYKADPPPLPTKPKKSSTTSTAITSNDFI